MRLAFTADVWEWRGPAPFYFVTVPEREAAMISSASSLVTYGWGMVPCSVTIGDTTITTALWPKDDSYVVPLKTAIRSAERIELGDTIDVVVEVNV